MRWMGRMGGMGHATIWGTSALRLRSAPGRVCEPPGSMLQPRLHAPDDPRRQGPSARLFDQTLIQTFKTLDALRQQLGITHLGLCPPAQHGVDPNALGPLEFSVLQIGVM